MNAHALAVLEFARVVEGVARHAGSESGAAHVRALTPGRDRARIELEHARVGAVRALRGSEGGWGAQRVPPAGQIIAKLAVADAAWTPPEARDAGVVLASAAATRASLRAPHRPADAVACLAPLVEQLVVAPALARDIARVVDEDGLVRDEASPVLRRVRRELRAANADLVRVLERAMAKLDAAHRVPDASVTVRNGRYVIPVRRDGRSAVGGIVHDTSASGGTLFVEPPAAVEAANHIRELEGEELRETDRVLRELTAAARPHADAMAATFDALAELDSLDARAKYADAMQCAPVRFALARDGIVVRDGRHPLLLEQGARVVPFDMALEPAERTLLVSGPNTGGKTVLLKALGLFHAMAQSGIPVPAAQGTTLPVVDDIFADIGDEQSIEASLSTFSAHLKNLREILMSATAESLVLIDELGSGTDPAEGAALGAAILESLTVRAVRTVATTHLGALKELPLTCPGVVNASLQFDEVALAPTYRLVIGVPGRSYGLRIAQRLALPADVLARAEARVPEHERAVSALLADLERRQAELDERSGRLHADEAATREAARRVVEREATVRERERDIQRRAHADARKYLLDARAEVERHIAALRDAALSERDDRARAARRAIEERADQHAAAVSSLDAEDAEGAPVALPAGNGPIDVGTAVDVATMGGRTGRVVEMRGDDAVVAIGAVKLTVPLGALRPASAASRVVVATPGDIPEHDARTEIDVRGVRAGDVEDVIVNALDLAVRADLKTMRIIHGKGTGALRERVAELLEQDSRVKQFRVGAWNEGGAGVTVVEFA